jgi:hypothetical protein
VLLDNNNNNKMGGKYMMIMTLCKKLFLAMSNEKEFAKIICYCK